MSNIPGLVKSNDSCCDTPSVGPLVPGLQPSTDDFCAKVNACFPQGLPGGGSSLTLTAGNYVNIGFTEDLYTMQYVGIDTFTFPASFTIDIDFNPEPVGTATSLANLVFLLNEIKLGDWTLISSAILEVVGNHIYGELKPMLGGIPMVIPDVLSMTVNTTGGVSMPNLYGSSAFDLSLNGSIAGNTTLMANIALMGFKYIGFPQGAKVEWLHYVDPPGTAYNFDPQNAIDFGYANPCDAGDGTMCQTYTYEFFDEYNGMMVDTNTDVGVISVNAVAPLYEFTNAPIDWDTVDIGSVNDEIDIILAKASGKYTVSIFELGMELTLPTWQGLFLNTNSDKTITSVTSSSGAVFHVSSTATYNAGDYVKMTFSGSYTNGKYWIGSITGTTFKLYTTRANAIAGTSPVAFIADATGNMIITGEGVWCKLLTHTNGTSAESIIDHIRSVAPSSKISSDSTRWDVPAEFYPDWIGAVAQLDVDYLRNYYQFYDQQAVDYTSARARIAQNQTFFDYITAARFNGKGTFMSQTEIKLDSPITNTVAQGLIIAEFYLTMNKQNLANGSPLSGITNFNLKKIFNANAGYAPRIQFNYWVMLGKLFKDGSELINITFDGPANDNLISLACSQPGDNIAIGIVNPTGNAYYQDQFFIDDTLFTDYTFTQRYGASPEATTDTAVSGTGNALVFPPYSFTVLEKTPTTSDVDFGFTKLGKRVQFTNNDGGSSWSWDLGDGSTSTLENPTHVYNDPGTYTVTLTIDGTDQGSHSVQVFEGKQPLWGVSINNIGLLVNDGNNTGIRTTLVDTIGYTYQSYALGSLNHWSHAVSATGYPTAIPTGSQVGMGGNLDEIIHFFTWDATVKYAASDTVTLSGQAYKSLVANNLNFSPPANPSKWQLITLNQIGAYDTHDDANNTGVDYFVQTVAYAKARHEVLYYFINVAHGTLAEMQTQITYMEAQNVPYVVIYGGEQTSGNTSADSPTGQGPSHTQAPSEYIAKTTVFDDWMMAHRPWIRRIIDGSLTPGASWNTAVATFAKSRGIEEFTQYAWQGDRQGEPNTNTNIGLYFTTAINNLRDSTAVGNNSIYGEIMPRISSYYTIYNNGLPNGLKMHLGQYGVSLQRSGFVAQTMLHGILVMNQLFEFEKFNDAHNGFVHSGTFLNEDEAGVSEVTSLDAGWVIDSTFQMTGGGKTFAIRMPGMPYKIMNDLANFDGVPEFLTVDRTGFPTWFDIIAYKLDDGTNPARILLYCYNINSTDKTITSILADGTPVGGDCDFYSVWGTELWASIGFNVAYSHFLPNNPGLLKLNVAPIDTTIPATTITIKKNSMTRIELNSIHDATTIKPNVT